MDNVRFGIVGVGNMGTNHVQSFLDNAIPGATLTAICETDADKRDRFAKKANVPVFAEYSQLLASGLVDAVLIAVPHYQHVPMALQAFEKGLHVLCEKPISVTVGEARRLNDAYTSRFSHLRFGIMFQLRTSPLLAKIRELIQQNELGELTRMTWIATDWFRTYTYYASGGWRATWAGEGGGVLINQCPHNLDMIGWLTGLTPQRVTAVAAIAKKHPIEVEDEVSAIIEFTSGAIGHFITTTGEAPGTNRLEIAGDRGKLVAEAGKLLFRRTRQSVDETNRTSPRSFINVETWDIEIPFDHSRTESPRIILQNFTNSILRNEPLLSPGVDGLKALELGNAMLMAGVTRQPVDFPVDAEAYEALIKDLTKRYGGKKQLQTSTATVDMSESFGNKATK
ncbi:MAG TPA: Gfo/Idh/MocA family oxidoreductase [Tepidisphaeraceae bacterium]|jgi:predicted dehydrogenase|nr:Gfo/Idh/MocA family oxidoreductase [Tepidisphaeraceae bacterium]